MEIDSGITGTGSVPDLSIIIPVFNGAEHLEEAVQTLSGIKDITYEVVIIDDGSTDKTVEVAERIVKEGNARLHSLPEHSGQSVARNTGISMARGNYVAFMDADELLLAPTAGAVREAYAREADVLHGSGILVPIQEMHVHVDDGQQVSYAQEFKLEGSNSALLNGTPNDIIGYYLKNDLKWISQGKLYRREFILKHDIRFHEDILYEEDMFFILMCLMHAEHYVLYSQPFYLYKKADYTREAGESSARELKPLLEIEGRGLKLLEDLFRELPSQEYLPLAKESFCVQMDQLIEPLSLTNPEEWGSLVQEETSLLQDSWWIGRHLSGLHKISVEKKNLLADKQNQEAALAANENLLDRALKAPRIILLSSIYTMLLCMLYFRDWDKSIFVCCGGIPSRIIHNLKKNGVLCYGKGDGYFINDVNVLRCLAKYAERNRIPVYGNDDPPEGGQFIQLDFTVVEDGNYNYRPEVVKELKNARRVAAGGETYLPFGFNRFVKHVLLTGKHPVPSIVKKKAKLIKIHKLWNQKTKKEQDEILDIYSFPRQKIEDNLKNGKDCLLLGVSSSSIGLCTEEQEIAMYREMMEPFGQERFIIKPHHQNRVDLRKYFPNCLILPKDFPIDLVELLGLEFHRVIGANCSALFNVFSSSIVEDRTDLMEKHGIPLSASDKETGKVQGKHVEEPPVKDECPPPEDEKELSKVQMYENLHKEHPEYGTGGTEILSALSCIIDFLSPKSILDYGCGKGGLVAALEERYPNVDVYGYDPAVERFSSMPVEKADLVVCTDVLEHITEEELPETIERIASISKNAFFHLHHGKAIFYLENGENAHCTIWTQEQYRELFNKYFHETFFLPGLFHINSVCVSFPLSQDIREDYIQRMADAHANILLQRMRR